MVSARAGRGLRKLPAIRGYARAVTLLWAPGKTHTTCIEQQSESGQIAALSISRDHADWSTLRVLQVFLGSEEAAVAQAARGGDFPDSGPQPLPPIPEGDEEANSGSDEALSDYLTHEDPELQQAIQALTGDWSTHLVDAECFPEILREQSDRMPLQYYRSLWLNVETYPAPFNGEEDVGSELCVELGIEYTATNLLPEAISLKGKFLFTRPRPQAPAVSLRSVTTTCSHPRR